MGVVCMTSATPTQYWPDMPEGRFRRQMDGAMRNSLDSAAADDRRRRDAGLDFCLDASRPGRSLWRAGPEIWRPGLSRWTPRNLGVLHSPVAAAPNPCGAAPG